MTFEETARSILDSFDWPLTASNRPELIDIVKNAIKNAATCECEECAKVAENYVDPYQGVISTRAVAAAIRSRK